MATERKKVRGRKGKLGKNKHRIASYYASNRYEMTRLRRLRRHVMQYGSGDKSATKAVAVLKAALPLHLSKTVTWA